MSTLLGNKLTWQDNNDFEDGFRIYRSTTTFTKETLPPVYAELPPNSQSFLDTEIVMGTTYYYMVSTYSGEKEIFAPNVQAIFVNYIPELIGEAMQGGYYIGNMTIPSGVDAGIYAIIMAGTEGQSTTTRQWKVRTDSTPNTESLIDGLANTYAMVAAGIDDHPAAKWCIDYAGGGFSDWYLPSKDELNLAWVNRFDLDALAMPAEYFWSSSQNSANYGWRQTFSSGSQNSYNKTNAYRVRPVRRLKIYNSTI